MIDYLTIGATPCDEPCASVGVHEDYAQQARLECKALAAQLLRAYPCPEGSTAYLYTKANPHDFGAYYEVAVRYDEDDEAGCNWAYLLEANLPERWDEQAVAWLLANGYRHLSPTVGEAS